MLLSMLGVDQDSKCPDEAVSTIKSLYDRLEKPDRRGGQRQRAGGDGEHHVVAATDRRRPHIRVDRTGGHDASTSRGQVDSRGGDYPRGHGTSTGRRRVASRGGGDHTRGHDAATDRRRNDRGYTNRRVARRRDDENSHRRYDRHPYRGRRK